VTADIQYRKWLEPTLAVGATFTTFKSECGWKSFDSIPSDADPVAENQWLCNGINNDG
jgi:hypothetical protein